MIFDILAFSCPLLLAATGALFSEYAGILALYMDGLITLSGFLTFLFTVLTGNLFAGITLSLLSAIFLTFCFSLIIEKTKANPFIAAIGINLLFSAVVSLLSAIFFKTRGVLTSPDFSFPVFNVKLISLIATVILIGITIWFLKATQHGSYFRITGSDPDVLLVKGINPGFYRIASWTISGFFACGAGTMLALRISSFVPNLSSGRGWMALAAVFLGKRKLWKIAVCVMIFCGADYFSTSIQNILPGIPSSLLLALPYLVALLLIAIEKKD